MGEDESTILAAERALVGAFGYRVVSLADGRCELLWEPTPPWVNRFGGVFGGIAAAMIDQVAGLAVATRSVSGGGGATTNLHVDYLRPMTLGLVYTCIGEAVRVGRRVSVGDARILDPGGRLMVRGTATYAVFPVPAVAG